MRYIILLLSMVVLIGATVIGQRQMPRYVEEEHVFCVEEGIERVFGEIDAPNWDYLKYAYYQKSGWQYDPALQHLLTDFKGTAEIMLFDLPPPPPNEIMLTVRFFLQGYYQGNGMMRQAHDMIDSIIQPRWPMPISDLCIISLHEFADYDNVVFTDTTFLAVDGYAHTLVPDSLCGDTVWLSVRQRNHLETVHADTLILCP